MNLFLVYEFEFEVKMYRRWTDLLQHLGLTSKDVFGH